MKHGLLLITILSLSSVTYSQKFIIEKVPNWVKSVSIPSKSEVKKYDVSSGYYLTLADYQYNLDLNASYSHNVINVVSYSGITNASQISVTYDTSYQQLKIHHLYVWRNGIKSSRTEELHFKILNNEYQLQNGLYMGLITAYCNLNDIRKDDMIDFAYTLVGKNPIFNNEKHLFIPLETTNPVDLYSIRVLYAKDKTYTYACVACDSNSILKSSVTDNYRLHEIELNNVKASTFEEHIPSWVIPYKYFTLSSIHSWKDVNNWAQRVFSLKTEPELQSVFTEIFTGRETTEDKINKIINYVQDDIRYMGIESGIGSIKPFHPNQVIKRRFGDCKDKSLLLVSLLKKIGINEAYPVLVNTYMKHRLIELHPSNEIFDHCIVKFTYRDTSYWIDPTQTQQGGNFKTITTTDFGSVLIIGDTSNTLSVMNSRKDSSSINITDVYTIKSFTDPASLIITSNRSGYQADIRRIIFEQNSTEAYSKYVTDDLKLSYPIVNQKADIELNDDIEKNIFSTTYNYEIDGFWQDGDKLSDKNAAGYWIFKFEPTTLYPEFSSSTCIERKFEYALDFPLNMNYKVIFHFPKDLFIHDEFTKYENDAFYFDEKVEQLSSNSFQVNYSYKTKLPAIPADTYMKICEVKNMISKRLPIIIYFNK